MKLVQDSERQAQDGALGPARTKVTTVKFKGGGEKMNHVRGAPAAIGKKNPIFSRANVGSLFGSQLSSFSARLLSLTPASDHTPLPHHTPQPPAPPPSNLPRPPPPSEHSHRCNLNVSQLYQRAFLRVHIIGVARGGHWPGLFIGCKLRESSS